MTKERELYEVFTLRLANWLAQHGYYIVSVMVDRKNPHYKTFLFNDSEDLRACIEEFKQQRKR